MHHRTETFPPGGDSDWMVSGDTIGISSMSMVFRSLVWSLLPWRYHGVTMALPWHYFAPQVGCGCSKRSRAHLVTNGNRYDLIWYYATCGEYTCTCLHLYTHTHDQGFIEGRHLPPLPLAIILPPAPPPPPLGIQGVIFNKCIITKLVHTMYMHIYIKR